MTNYVPISEAGLPEIGKMKPNLLPQFISELYHSIMLARTVLAVTFDSEMSEVYCSPGGILCALAPPELGHWVILSGVLNQHGEVVHEMEYHLRDREADALINNRRTPPNQVLEYWFDSSLRDAQHSISWLMELNDQQNYLPEELAEWALLNL